jgi:hypothetical protein
MDKLVSGSRLRGDPREVMNANCHPEFDAMIAIYEPIYLPDQSLSEPSFRPLKLENNNRSEWREFNILVDMYRRGMHRGQSFTGLMSPKFRLKTKVTGSQFIDFVQDNVSADVCFINPFAHHAYISFNVWTQGEVFHPGLAQRAQQLLDASGLDWKITDVPRHGPATLCYCNFWVGTEHFWDDYVGGILVPIAEFLENNPDHPVSLSVHTATRHHLGPAPFLPFIVERLFSSFLSLAPREIISKAYPMDPFQSCKYEFHQEVVAHCKSEVDAADNVGAFPDSLKNNMALLCKLWRLFSALSAWEPQ